MMRRMGLIAVLLCVYASSQAAIVKGVVKEGDSTGNAIAQAVVSLSMGGGGGGQTLRDTTDSTGAFSFADVAVSNGNRTLTASKTGYQQILQSLVQVTDSTATYTRNIYLISTSMKSTLAGIVSDSASGDAVSAVVVLTRNNGVGVRPDTVITGATGKYSFDSLVGATTYRVTASASGYNSRVTNVTITTSTQTANIKLVKILYGSIIGTIADSADGKGISGAKVRLRNMGATVDSAVCGADGAYSFSKVESGYSYSISASATGYNTRTSTAKTLIGTNTDTINLKLLAITFGKLTGKVTSDSLKGSALAGVKLVLSQTGVGAVLDSTISSSEGIYLFSKVQAGQTYRITASLTGYNSKTTNVNNQTSGTDTANIFLIPITFGKITGKITADSATGSALSGAKVVLSSAIGIGTVIDSTTSNTEGVYVFSKVQAGQRYSVIASLSGYTARAVNSGLIGTIADTVNVALIKIGVGTLYVKVLKRSDSTALAGASVVVTENGAAGLTLTGSTAASGMAIFDNLEITGNSLSLSITASEAGFTPASGSGMVPKNGKDTATIYLAASANGTKMLTGIVKDSSSKSPLAHVQVEVTVSSGGIGGQSFRFIDSTGADGKYSIEGIPVTSTQATVAVTCTGYRASSRNLILGAANKADTTTFNVSLLATTAISYSPSRAAINKMPEIMVTGSGLRISNLNQNGFISLISVSGKLLARKVVTGASNSISIPASLTKTGSAFIISITQGSAVYRQRIIMP